MKNLDVVFSSETCTSTSAVVSRAFICPVGGRCCKPVFFLSALSDAFDFQFGAVVLRLKEGLDVSHIQGQGKWEVCSSALLRSSAVAHLSLGPPLGGDPWGTAGLLPGSLLFSPLGLINKRHLILCFSGTCFDTELSPSLPVVKDDNIQMFLSFGSSSETETSFKVYI